jgi:hypothetical protein
MEPILDSAADRLVARLDEMDCAIGAHLRMLIRRRPNATVGDCRRAIVAWCSCTEARGRFDAEILNGAAYALDTMDDTLLGPLVRDLLRSAGGRPRSSAA